MLDQNTKRNIDSARQILVGKVPDPKAQVEQITTALIYKFMDDMDKESEELGGKAKFFANDFSQYSWTKLLDNKLSGEERLNLYVQAITNMPKNPHIPQLFRDIFKGAFLPYNDPRTLSLFLKEINEFTYEHSENLGNAFEYLLSILGSQGDAGQFRTPRHIIDFIVEVVNPKKNETILDPACGTAGFLISAYKHILSCHSHENGNPTLTPDEKLKLMNNLAGYDISPDMVKLALVNMYLHGFPEPKIHEYDSLTSEKRWDETFDVILANPPFMTPTGGIRPHKRFSIQANRSEVLFVDYIMDHLTIKGRAGIIVPEGIIFQSNNAYKALRKKLVEDGLLAVVSLPSGVFNPYAGVKTSILIFDKEIAKQTKEILFVKIENDGFDLGAQRRPIDKNNLPQALAIIKKFQKIQSDKDFTKEEREISLLVERSKIAENGDYNLTGERYRKSEIYINQKWPMVELGEVADVGSGNSAPQNKNLFENGKYSFFRTSDVGAVHICDNLFNSRDKLNDAGTKGLKLFPRNTILFPKSGASTFLNHRAMLGIDGYIASHLATITPNENKILPKFLFNLLNKIDAKTLTSDQNYPSLKISEIKKIKIPLPPLSIQKEIVEQIEVKQKAIDSAKEVIKNLERERRYFGASLRKLEGVEWVELGEVCDINPKKSEVKDKNFEVSFVPMSDVNEHDYYFEPKQTKNIREVYKGYTYFAENDVLLAKITPCFENGKSAIARKLKNGIGFGSTEFIVLRTNKKTIPEWVYNFIANTSFIDEGKNHMTGSAGQRRLNIDFVRSYKIPLPPLGIQKQLVAEAEKEQEIIDANKKLIEIMKKKIEDVLSEI